MSSLLSGVIVGAEAQKIPYYRQPQQVCRRLWQSARLPGRRGAYVGFDNTDCILWLLPQSAATEMLLDIGELAHMDMIAIVLMPLR